jgi:hypothetical protein
LLDEALGEPIEPLIFAAAGPPLCDGSRVDAFVNGDENDGALGSLNRRRRLDVDDHEVPCGVHFFSIAACTDKNAESVGAQRYTVSTTNIGQRWAARQTVCSISFRISGPVDCYQIVTGELSYFPLPRDLHGDSFECGAPLVQRH